MAIRRDRRVDILFLVRGDDRCSDLCPQQSALTMTGCTHEIWEQNAAIAGDGLCPLCLRDEIERLRAALRCEAETGICIMVHEPEREPCTSENCRMVRAAEQHGREAEK